MNVAEALGLMRQAKSSLDSGNYGHSCALYDRVVRRFPTWWMSLVGRVECGLERADAPETLASMLASAERYEAPREVVATLRAKTLSAAVKCRSYARFCSRRLKRAPCISAPSPASSLYVAKGRLGDSVRLVLRMRAEGNVEMAALRLGRGALLTRDGEAADIFLPDFLAQQPDTVLMVRYIRDLRRRGQDVKAEAWTETWAERVRAGLPSRLSRN